MSPTLTLLKPGLRTLVVDAGRPRSRGLGVPVGGAADRFAWAIGNALVGNAPDVAALEVALAGPTLVADAPLACVLAGAPFLLGTDRRPLTAGTTFTLEPGEILTIGGTPVGVRAYLCIHGGIDVSPVLGSRSSLSALTAGTALGCVAGRIGGRSLGGENPLVQPIREPIPLRTLPGGQTDWFPAEVFSSRTFRVGPASDRMGVRLLGEPIPVPGREMISEPACPGTVQVTRDGQCIVLGVDGQTIGGYPRLAQVIAADLDRLAQLRPGTGIVFHMVSPEEAERLWRERGEQLRGWLARLETTLDVARVPQ